MVGSIASDRKFAPTPFRGPSLNEMRCFRLAAKRLTISRVVSRDPSSDTINIQFAWFCAANDASCSSRKPAPSLVHSKIATCAVSISRCRRMEIPVADIDECPLGA